MHLLFSDKDQAFIRVISIRQLRALLPFHTGPINVVVYNVSFNGILVLR